MAQLVGSNSLGLGKLIDGKNQFVHIMYSANADGSNMTAEIQSNTKYIGIVTSSSETPPVNPSDYSWGRFVGTSGTSSYTWIRYSPNEDGSNMTTTANEGTKYIGVAITSENSAPTDYTKYSWALFKGDDGRGIEKTEVTYQKSTSGTVIPTGSWVTSIPSLNDGEYLWTRTLFTYTDNTTTSTFSVSRNGVTGLGISKTDVHYQKSTSGTTAPTGTWTTTIPTVASNEYLWTRTTITYTNATTSVSYSVGKMGADGKDAQLLYLTASSQIQAFDKDNQPKTTQAITISAKLQNTSGVATFVAIPYIGNIAQTPITLGGTGNERTLLPTQWTNAQWTTIAITATLGSLTDTISVVRVKDGSTGPKGDQGNQGIQGPPGSDGEPTYIHWAYAWSADGTDRFTTSYPNENLFRNSESPNAVAYADAALTKTTGVSVPEWGAITAVKYAISGGTSTIACAMQGGSNTSAGIKENYDISIYVKNTGSKAFSINGNITSGVRIEPGEAKRVTWLVKDYSHPTGANRQFSINRVVAGEAIEFVIWKAKFAYGTYNSIWTPMPSEDFANAYPTFAGSYVDNQPTDSEDPADYVWQRLLGDEGESGSNYWINPSVNTVKKSATGEIKPTTITFTSFTKKGKEDTKEYPGRFVIHTSINGSTWTARYTATTDSASYTYTIPTGVNFIRARVYDAGGTTVLLSDVSVPIVEDVEGLEIGNRNYFSVKAWNTKPALTINGIPYMDIKLEPNTQYTLSTNIPSRDTLRDVFFLKGTDTPSSLVNGVAKNLPLTLTTNADGIVKVAVRDYNLSSGYWIMLSKGNKAIDWQPALEDAQLYTAWSNDPNGKDMVRVYPNENLILDSQIPLNVASANATDNYAYATVFKNLEKSTTYTFSSKVSSPTGYTLPTAITVYVYTSPTVSMESQKVTAYITDNYIQATITTDNRYDNYNLIVYAGQQGSTGGNRVTFIDRKLEKADKATIYTPSPQDDPVKAEMAYIGYSPKDSNDPADYVWSENPKAKGTFKRWANSPDGKVDFITQYPNENLFTITRPEVKNPAATNAEFLNNPNWNMAPIFDNYGVGIPYTLSFDLKSAVAGPIQVYSQNGSGTKYNIGSRSVEATTEFQRFTVTFTPQLQTGTTQTQALLAFYGTYSSGRVPTVRNLKLELGSVATLDIPSVSEDLLATIPRYTGIGSKDSMNPADFIWTISPEYTQALADLGLEDKVDNGSYENDKSDIWEEISNRTTEEEAAAIREMAESIKNSYEAFISSGGQYQLDLEALEARSALLVQNLGDQLATYNFLKTYIKLGEEGLVIGADGSSMKMLLSKDKLSFTDGGQVVAYFSNQSFYINRGAIVDSLQVGQHKMVKLNSDHTVFQWVKV